MGGKIGTVREVFGAFLKLGCVAFGGPVAHLGFYEAEFVRKRQWITSADYADLVALCQFLPGPSSSQVGFAMGLKRAGLAGAFAAWAGFTLPAAILMLAFALGLDALGTTAKAGWISGLKLAAVAVVAQALWNLATKLCPDRERALLALGAACGLLLLPGSGWQALIIALGGGYGWWRFRPRSEVGEPSNAECPSTPPGWPWLAAFAVLLLGLPLLASLLPPNSTAAVVSAFYRAGSLVFGGGHVVLPLLDAYTVAPGWVDRETFLAGYGAVQALPGPLFSFNAYLGASLTAGPGGPLGGALALVAVYVPSWLLVLGALPYWERLRRLRSAKAALMGANATVVGLLLAAFYDPVWSEAVTSPQRAAFALAAFGTLRFLRLPPWALVVFCALLGSWWL